MNNNKKYEWVTKKNVERVHEYAKYLYDNGKLRESWTSFNDVLTHILNDIEYNMYDDNFKAGVESDE